MLHISRFNGRSKYGRIRSKHALIKHKTQAPKGLLNTYTPQTNLRFNEGSNLSTKSAKPQIAPGFAACVYTNINRLFVYAIVESYSKHLHIT